MPIKVSKDLPAHKILNEENVFIMDEMRAMSQDIRPLKIAILNLMPKKIETETQLLRLLGNTPLQVDIELLQMASHKSKNTPQEHLLKFYNTFEDVKNNYFDGLIITGAPVEMLDYQQVDYWDELCAVMEWSKTNVFSTFYICWGAQAGLYYHYGINKVQLDKKMFGLFPHEQTAKGHYLLYGFDDIFYVPHSRHTGIDEKAVEENKDLIILSRSKEAGIYMICDKEAKKFFITGHSEYDRDTLANEYFRDLAKGLEIEVPVNYFPDNDPKKTPIINWRAHANMLFSNWLNYFVYQRTPYDYIER